MVGLIINFKIGMNVNSILRYLYRLYGFLILFMYFRLKIVVCGRRLGAWRLVRKLVNKERMKNFSGDI